MTSAPLSPPSAFWPADHAAWAQRGPCLWVDDERQPPPVWHWAKTAAEAIARLEQGGVAMVSLDHDLGPPEAGTGYDVAVWIEARAALHDGPVPLAARIHSANPVGRQRMTAALARLSRGMRPRGGR